MLRPLISRSISLNRFVTSDIVIVSVDIHFHRIDSFIDALFIRRYWCQKEYRTKHINISNIPIFRCNYFNWFLMSYARNNLFIFFLNNVSFKTAMFFTQIFWTFMFIKLIYKTFSVFLALKEKGVSQLWCNLL